MRIYEYGKKTNPTLLLLPGTCCHHEINFGKVIPLLESDFHVLSVSYDGFDENENTIFPDMLTETKKIERFVCDHFQGRIFAAYGCSLGGSFVGLLVQRKVISIEHAILGSSDLDQDRPFPAMLKGKIVSSIFMKMLHSGELPAFMQKRLQKKPKEEMEYYTKLFASLGIGNEKMKFVKKESIYRQFYSDLVTPLETNIAVPGTTIHIFYAVKMGEQYEKRYLEHFQNPDIIRMDLQHEELLFCTPEKWCQCVRKVCGLSA